MRIRLGMGIMAMVCSISMTACGQLANDVESSNRMEQASTAPKTARQAPPGYKVFSDSGYSWLIPSSYEVEVAKTDGVEDLVHIFPSGQEEKTINLVMRVTYWFVAASGAEGRKAPVQQVGEAKRVSEFGGSVMPAQRVVGTSGVQFDKIAYTYQNSPGFSMASTSDDGISAWTQLYFTSKETLTPDVCAEYEKIVLSTKKD
jgi:hypothetical protein